jgi:hypothetical protein
VETTERHSNLVANFVNGYAADWYMAVKECYRNELDIKYIERKKGHSDFFEYEFESQEKDIQKLCKAIKGEGYKLGIIDTSENNVDWLNSILQLTYLYEEVITKKRDIDIRKEKKEVQKLREQTGESRIRPFKDLKDYEQEAIKRLNRLTIELAYPQEAPKSGKTSKQSVFEWTQGQYFSFAEGHLFYDTPKGYEKWEKALRAIKTCCKIVSSTPTGLNKNKKLLEGMVVFTTYKPDEKFTSLKAVKDYKLSQTEFVNFLKTGVLNE